MGAGASIEEFKFPLPTSYAGLSTEQQEFFHVKYSEKIKVGKSPIEAIAELDAEFDTIEAERLEKKTEDEFKALDADGDGHVTRQELSAAIPSATVDELEEIIGAADADGNGTIEIGEYKATIEKEIEAEEIKQEFEIIDSNNDGIITTAEMENFVEVTNADVDAKEGMEIMDANCDGGVDIKEFTKVMATKGDEE